MRNTTFMLCDDCQIIPEHQIIIIVNGSPEGVFDWETGIVAFPGCDGSIAGFEIGSGYGDDVLAEEFAEGFFGVGSWFSLVAYADGSFDGCGWCGINVGG
jgi:hypothetical protein